MQLKNSLSASEVQQNSSREPKTPISNCQICIDALRITLIVIGVLAVIVAFIFYYAPFQPHLAQPLWICGGTCFLPTLIHYALISCKSNASTEKKNSFVEEPSQAKSPNPKSSPTITRVQSESQQVDFQTPSSKNISDKAVVTNGGLRPSVLPPSKKLFVSDETAALDTDHAKFHALISSHRDSHGHLTSMIFTEEFFDLIRKAPQLCLEVVDLWGRNILHVAVIHAHLKAVETLSALCPKAKEMKTALVSPLKTESIEGGLSPKDSKGEETPEKLALRLLNTKYSKDAPKRDLLRSILAEL